MDGETSVRNAWPPHAASGARRSKRQGAALVLRSALRT